MNKTLNINLGGLVFHIDEEAYKVLKVYLSKIKDYLENEEGFTEIIQDIESRIAELFREWKQSGEVIGQVEVERIQELLGRPEDYLVGEELENSSKAKNSRFENLGVRKLFRDMECGMIGGVCSGIANYLSVDRIWIRLCTILLLIGIGWIDFGGTTLIIYIILWIIIPEAKTTTERLQMHGKPINLENIKEFTEELGQNIQNGARKSEPHIQRLSNFIIRVAKIIGKIILIFFGIKFLIVAIGLFIMFLTVLSGLVFGEFEYIQFFDRIVEYSWQYYAYAFSITLIIAGLIIFLVTLGISLIKINFEWYKGFIIGLIGIFIGGFTLLSLGLSQWSHYSYKHDLEKEYTIPAINNIAIPIDVTNFLEGVDKELDRGFVHIVGLENNYFFDQEGALIYQMRYVDLDIKKSIDDEIHFVNRFEASGRNREEALKNAKAIQYKVTIDSTKIMVGKHFSIPKDMKWRKQEVKSILYLPVGQKVLLSTEFFLKGDLINFAYRDEEEMRIWQMTEEGFVCLDCM
ncbi:MAG: PspC domain-containing protein [Flavobacteriales bacterium]